ncbi:transposase [Micromonospora sp. NPDC047738]|uniref:transposase n=1 Tax=Micromonospora sp. NPDC047738 TaxID=3155741 RepID=UPI0033D3BD55
MAELHRLATTIETWWPQIHAFLHTGITNAGSEGTNRVIKLGPCVLGDSEDAEHRVGVSASLGAGGRWGQPEQATAVVLAEQ